jgi:hypothetical protein
VEEFLGKITGDWQIFLKFCRYPGAGVLGIGFCKIAKRGISAGTNPASSGGVFSEHAPFLLSVLFS